MQNLKVRNANVKWKFPKKTLFPILKISTNYLCRIHSSMNRADSRSVRIKNGNILQKESLSIKKKV